MITLSPHDTPVGSDASEMKDTNFGGNREYTTGKQVKSQDYTSRDCGAPNKKENPYEETTKDVDDMTDPEARKREFSRRAETSTVGDHNKEHFHETDPENRPPEDTTAFIPDDKKHTKKMRFQYGSGQYDNNPNRGNYEGEVR
jgi:hypothetical protein